MKPHEVIRMTPQEAIKAIKNNYPDERYAMLREALDIAIEALKLQQEFEQMAFCISSKYEDYHEERERLGMTPQKFVTCKDCKHWDLSMSYGYARMCEHWQDTMREYGYCSYGERRDEE